MKPLNVSWKDFLMSTASAEGMIIMQPQINNYDIFYRKDIIYIEGNDRKLHLQIPELAYPVQRSFVVAVLEHRGSEYAPFPAQNLNAKTGVHFMKTHTNEYSIRPKNVFLIGNSSGTHTAIMTAFSSLLLPFSPLYTFPEPFFALAH